MTNYPGYEYLNDLEYYIYKEASEHDLAWYGIGPDGENVDFSYTFKSVQIGDNTYFALFKTLNDGETAADYAPIEQPSPEYADAVKAATEAGLLYNNSNCLYQEPITKQDFCILLTETLAMAENLDLNTYFTLHKFAGKSDVYRSAPVRVGFVDDTDKSFEPFDNITLAEASDIFKRIAANLNIDDFVDVSDFSGEYMTREQAYYCLYQLYTKYNGGADYAALSADEIVQLPSTPKPTESATEPTAATTPIPKDNKTPLTAALAVTVISAAVFLLRILKDNKH